MNNNFKHLKTIDLPSLAPQNPSLLMNKWNLNFTKLIQSVCDDSAQADEDESLPRPIASHNSLSNCDDGGAEYLQHQAAHLHKVSEYKGSNLSSARTVILNSGRLIVRSNEGGQKSSEMAKRERNRYAIFPHNIPSI